MIDRKLLLSYISRPELICGDDVALLARAVEEYPYSQILRMLYLKALHNSSDFSFEANLARSAAYISDRKALFELINGIEGVRERVDFQTQLVLEDDSKELNEWINEQKQDVSGMDALIDRFIQTNPRIKPSTESPSPQNEDVERAVTSAIMTETLARIYAEQGKFEQAIEAFRILMLQNPAKAECFSAQIEMVRARMK